MHPILFSFVKHSPGKAIYGDKSRDTAAAKIKFLLDQEVIQKTTTESNLDTVDLQDMQRAEDEGMIIHPSPITSTYKIIEHTNQ